jgi:hypothetical protein
MARVEGDRLIDILNNIANACHIFLLFFKNHVPSMSPLQGPFPQPGVAKILLVSSLEPG